MAKPIQNLFDLSKNDVSKSAEAGFEFELVMPGSVDSTGAFITVRGELSNIVKQFDKKSYNEYQMQLQAAKRKNKDKEYTISLDEAEEMAVNAAVNRVISWRGLADAGVEIQFSKQVAETILKDHPWIREQIMEESKLALNFRPK